MPRFAVHLDIAIGTEAVRLSSSPPARIERGAWVINQLISGDERINSVYYPQLIWDDASDVALTRLGDRAQPRSQPLSVSR